MLTNKVKGQVQSANNGNIDLDDNLVTTGLINEYTGDDSAHKTSNDEGSTEVASIIDADIVRTNDLG